MFYINYWKEYFFVYIMIQNDYDFAPLNPDREQQKLCVVNQFP